MHKKYRLRLDLKLELGFVTLYRIERVSTGELGGYIEQETNLSQDGNAWVYGDACVYGNACVSDNAYVSDNACVYGNAKVYGNACVYGDACVYGNACVYGDACVYGNACVYGDAQVSSRREIINFIVAFSFSVTITPDNMVIGCQLKSRKDWLKVTIEDAEKMGLPQEMYPHYRKMIRAGMKLVPARKKVSK